MSYLITKTYLFSAADSLVPTFGFTIKAGVDPLLFCSPRRVIDCVESYSSFEMHFFTIVNGEKIQKQLNQIPELSNNQSEWIQQWSYRYSYPGKLFAHSMNMVAVKEIIKIIYDLDIDQYEPEVEITQ